MRSLCSSIWTANGSPSAWETHGRSSKRGPAPYAKKLDFLLGKFHLESKGSGEAVGQIGEAGEQVNIDDLRVGEFFLQRHKIRVRDIVGCAREFVDVSQRGAFLLVVAGEIARL